MLSASSPSDDECFSPPRAEPGGVGEGVCDLLEKPAVLERGESKRARLLLGPALRVAKDDDDDDDEEDEAAANSFNSCFNRSKERLSGGPLDDNPAPPPLPMSGLPGMAALGSKTWVGVSGGGGAPTGPGPNPLR